MSTAGPGADKPLKLYRRATKIRRLTGYGLAIEDVPLLTKRRIEYMQTIAHNPHLTIAQVANLLGIAESTLRRISAS